MKVLAMVTVFDRLPLLAKWLQAWQNADKPNARLLVARNVETVDDMHAFSVFMKDRGADELLVRKNEGQDIGVLKTVLDFRFRHYLPVSYPFGDWDVLYVSTDDALPMCKEFLAKFLTPLTASARVQLCANYIVPDQYYPGVRRHARTVSFAIKAEAAERLVFPDPLVSKQDAWEFEYGACNMLEQVLGMGFDVCTPYTAERDWWTCNDVVWDCGEINGGIHWDSRRQHDHWEEFEAQFVRGSQCLEVSVSN